MTVLAPPTSASKQKTHVPRIDSTPMVDLGFLLITFFIFTTTLSQPAIIKLIVPKKGENTTIAQSKALTLLLDKDKAYTYDGFWEEALTQRKIRTTDYHLQTGLGNSIRQKQKRLPAKGELAVLIKPLPTASYQSVIAALDEMQINNVTHYALVDATAAEKSFVQGQ
jgi:biopolymer transport protein ExbD